MAAGGTMLCEEGDVSAEYVAQAMGGSRHGGVSCASSFSLPQMHSGDHTLTDARSEMRSERGPTTAAVGFLSHGLYGQRPQFARSSTCCSA